MKKRFSRTILMIAGIATVALVVLSQAIYVPAMKDDGKAKTNQKTSPLSHAKITQAQPNNGVPSSTVQVDKNTPTLLKSPALDEEREKTVFIDVRILIPYFKTLFRAIISPNAP